MARAFAVLGLLLALPSAARADDCPGVGDTPLIVAAVEPRLELRLGDGRRLRLVGVEPATGTPSDPDLGESGRTALAAAVAGAPLTGRLASDKPDRWGRLPAFVFRTGDASPGGLAALAVARGFGRFAPEPAARGCREVLLAAETAARGAALGLWRDPYYGVLAVDDLGAFTERSATTVVAEGRLRRVDVGPFRTKLRFAAPHGSLRNLLVAVVPPKVVKHFGEQGVHLEALVGRTLRFRGLLDLRFGPQVEVESPDALELLPAGGSEPGAP